MAKLLRDKIPIAITWYCDNINGKYKCGNYIETDIEYTAEDKVYVEYHCKEDNTRYDVAIINGTRVRYIFEILVTHKTDTKRPEPWFEIKAIDLLDSVEYCRNQSPGVLFLECKRTSACRRCIKCTLIDEDFVNDLPRLSGKNKSMPGPQGRVSGGVWCNNYWKWEAPCVICKRYKYSPIFKKGRRAVCKICFGNQENIGKLKEIAKKNHNLYN